MQMIPTAIWIGHNHRRRVVGASNLFISLNYPIAVLLFSSCYILLFHEDNVDLTASSSFLPEIPVTTSLTPYTNTAIPITIPASAIPNTGVTIIAIDKATANAPAPMLNALEPLLAVVFIPFFSLLFPPLRPATICSIPNKSKIIPATVKVAATAITGKMIADNDSPTAIAPIPICKALTHVGDFALIILVVVMIKHLYYITAC